MTSITTYRSKDIESILKGITQYSIGMEDWLNRLESFGSTVSTNYPPYNIIKQSAEKWVIEVALAGWNREDIEVSSQSNVLMVCSKDSSSKSKEGTYYHRGVASREFTKTFNLSDDVEIGKVSFVNGLLTIELNKIIPEHQKRKVYEIV